LKNNRNSIRFGSKVEQEHNNCKCWNIEDANFENNVEKLTYETLNKKDSSSQNYHNKRGYAPCLKLLLVSGQANFFQKKKIQRL